MMVASIVTARAFMILENAISQSVQVLGFIRLGLMPNTRNGTEKGPRKATGRCRFCQQPRHSVAGSGVIAFSRSRLPNLAPAHDRGVFGHHKAEALRHESGLVDLDGAALGRDVEHGATHHRSPR